MAKFTGVKCPVCNLPFAADDDIVVCPDCGTPHHRPCWESEGQCANTARHATGYEFAAPEADSTIACPGCGTACRESQHFCEHCGTRLLPDEVEKPAENPAYQPVFGQPATLGGDSASTPIYGSFAPGDPALTEQLDDYTLPEWANFIGPNAGYYILAFKRAKALGRYPFCWSAFFFAPVYFWFRKMWGWGALAGLCNIILSLPTLLINYSQLYGTTLPIPL